MTEHKNITKRTGIVSFFTLISRIFGLIRDIVVANFFGATWFADAFYMAFTIPNILRRLFAEGSMTIAFIPIFSEYLKKSKDEAKRVVNITFTYLLLFLVIVTIIGIIFAPYIVKLMAWGFSANPAKFNLTIYLTMLMFPYIIMVSLVALAMGILNSLKHFSSPAASPIVLNIGIIAVALFLRNYFDPPVLALAAGVLIGGMLQIALQIPFLVREGYLPRFSDEFKHEAARKIGKLFIPSIYGAAVYQLNVVIIRLLASFLPHGSVSYLWYSDRLMEFPLGVFAIAVATAILPTLSDHAAEQNWTEFKKDMNFGLRLTWFITVPAAVGLIMLSTPITKVVYERGMFDAFSTQATASALMAFAIGLPFIGGVRIIVPAFYALKDALTPVIISTIAVASNIILGLVLMHPMKHNGLALAISVSALINFVLLLFFLRKKVGLLGIRKLALSTAKIALCAGLMGAVLYGATHHGDTFFHSGRIYRNALDLVTVITMGMMTFFISAWLVKCEELKPITEIVLSKIKKKH
ncbi:murein biosynthesis integral membrane protein MurJ [bacterium]|nr:murein biosynthesis integral membrane protein MurJ [bacterium]